MLELDHLFVRVIPGAPEIDPLLTLGLREGSPNTHPGQGTANRRIFFRNVMLEFLWLTNQAEAESESIRRTNLATRCDPQRSDVSPFGICLRWSNQSGGKFPFATFAYMPPYLPSGMMIPMAESSNRLDEPLIFCISFGGRPDRASPERRQPIEHRTGMDEVTALRLTTPSSQPPSDALRYLIEIGLVDVVIGKTHHLLIEFDHGRQGEHTDFTVALPLSFTW